MKRIAAIALALSLAACASKPAEVMYQPMEVKVPVQVRRDAPSDLLKDITPDPDLKFISPADADASSALSKSGERALRRLVRDLNARISAWKAWAAE